MITMAKLLTKNTESDRCRICGDDAKYSYFGVLSCQACKVFFKRNAEDQQVMHRIYREPRSSIKTLQKVKKCPFDNQCEITILTRHVCTACRLKKCFDCGMEVEKIRRSKLVQQQRKIRSNNMSIDLVSWSEIDHFHAFYSVTRDKSSPYRHLFVDW